MSYYKLFEIGLWTTAFNTDLKDYCYEVQSKDQGRKKTNILGYQSNPWKFLSKSNLFVLPSIWEGFGNVIVESMLIGIPVISSDCPSGPREILNNGKSGKLFQVGDYNHLANIMEEIISSDNSGNLFLIPSLCFFILFNKSFEFIMLGFFNSAVFLIKILLSLVNLTVAPIGLIGKTPHSFGEPKFSNSSLLRGLVMLAVKVNGKL